MTFPFRNKNIPKCAIMHVEHDAKLVYCDVNINTFIFDTELQSEHLAMSHEIDIDLGCNKEAAMSEFDTFLTEMHCKL